MALQQGHGVGDLLIHALATAGVVGLLEALQADGGDEVLHPQQILAELLVNEGGVGEGQEGHVVVLLAQGDDVLLPHQRLAAGVDVHIDAQFLTLVMMESISSKDRFSLLPYSAAQQPVQCRLQAEVGSSRMAQGMLQPYFSRIFSCLASPPGWR